MIQTLKIKSSGEDLDATLLIPDFKLDKYPAVIFYHGSGSDKIGYVERSKPLVEKGIVCLAFSFRVCGESGGDLQKQTLAMATDDALLAFDFLNDHSQVDSERIGICGRSFGGYMAAIVSGKREVKSLALSVPAIYKDKDRNRVYMQIEEEEKQYFRNNSDFSENEAVKAIRSFKGDLLVIEHEKDTVVPQNVVKTYFNEAVNAASKRYGVIKGAPHHIANPGDNEKFKQLITDWFVNTL